MKLLFFNKYLNIILLTILVSLRQIPSVELSPEDLISLYNVTDKITVLTSENFSSAVHHSDTAWLIEYYAGWCGHCQSYANTYRKVAIDIWAWKTVVRIGAINCEGTENNVLCRKSNVRLYPTLQLIPPDATFDNKSKVIPIPASNENNVEKDLIKGLENLNTINKTWPRFVPVNRATLEELYSRIPKTIKLLFVIAETRDDFTGRQIMLDFSKHHEQIAIFRTTTDGILWRKFHISITDVPALFVILHNGTAERINVKQNISNNVGSRNLFNYAIRSYIHQTKSIDHFDNHDIKEIILGKNALKNAEKKQNLTQNNNITDDIRDKNTIHQKVNMIDLELALSYMFRQEIPQMQDIQGETYNALVQWLTVLTKYFPGREPVMVYLKHLLSKINEQSKGFSGNQFREIIDLKTSDAYLPDDHEQYQHCAGSAKQYRGYPCALWLLFHTLTGSQYKNEFNPINVTEIPIAIKNYIKYFFSCRQCSENFMQETANIDQLNSTNKYEAIIYLWKIHNHINKRLRDDITEDPKHPKVQFPSKYLCATCQSITTHEYNVSSTIDFLLQYYSKENIDTSLISKKSQQNKEASNPPTHVISKIDTTNGINDQFGFFTIILQRFSVYILIGLIVLAILVRHRFSRRKIKRYII